MIATKHFTETLEKRDGCNLPKKKLKRAYPKIKEYAKLASPNAGMVTLGGAKLIFSWDSIREKIILVTVMPKHYKHNLFKRAKTVDFGTIKDSDLIPLHPRQEAINKRNRKIKLQMCNIGRHGRVYKDVCKICGKSWKETA